MGGRYSSNDNYEGSTYKGGSRSFSHHSQSPRNYEYTSYSQEHGEGRESRDVRDRNRSQQQGYDQQYQRGYRDSHYRQSSYDQMDDAASNFSSEYSMGGGYNDYDAGRGQSGGYGGGRGRGRG